MIDLVSETQRINWKEAPELNIFEFLNTMCYRIERDRHKADVEKQEMDRIKNSRTRSY